jgi:hypothetical protein
MKIELRLCALLWICLSAVAWAQEEVPEPEDVPTFLKEMERKAGEISSSEAKWVRKTFAPTFGLEGEGRQQELIATVRFLEEQRSRFSTAILGYLKGAHWLVAHQGGKRWNDWHRQIDHFKSNPKSRKDAEAYLKHAEALFASGMLRTSPAATWKMREGSIDLTVDAEGKPLIECNEGMLVCLSKGDSTRVMNVSGTYNPLTGRFFGRSGSLNWERTTNAETFDVELGAFEIRMKGSSFSADSAQLTSTLFDEPLQGQATVKVQKERKENKRTYPRFESNSGRIQLKDIFENVHYDGGLQVRGSQLAGMGSDGRPAQLSIFQDDTMVVRCLSNEVLFAPDGISATHAVFSLILGEDSITHPDIKVNYLDKQKVFRATRQEDGVGMQPFVDSYHALEFEVEVVEWPVEGSIVEFRRLTSGRQEPAPFRSLDSFVRGNYDAMRGVDNIHPLSRLSGYVRSSGVGFFHSDEFADHLGLPEEQARLMLIRMTNAGYVDFNTASRECQVKPRLQRHIDARAGKIDYDVVAFNSNPSNSVTNATMSLGNRRLLLRGIGRFNLSEAQDVNIIPDKGLLSIGRNRNFEFDGIIQAGKFELEGTDFEFDYEAFKLEVRRAESLRIQAEVDGEFDQRGNPKLRWVKSVIEELTGTLEIDNPGNKSGWKSEEYPQFPVLTSREISNVYYDAPGICKGAYHRDKFNYAVDPFVIDSLDNFKKEDLVFEGELLAGGIVPDLREPLRLMADYSLGFTRSTPPEGYPLYDGLGTVAGDLTLNWDGLHGPGTIDFLTSHLEGEDNTLVPDSAYGRTTLYDNVAVAGNIPFVTATETDFGLQSKGKRLFVRSRPSSALKFFEEEVYLDGELELDASRMTGQGTFEFEKAQLSARDFLMKERTIDSQKAAFELQGGDLDEVAFGTEDVFAHVDFDARRGDFKAKDGATLIDLPAIRYQCLMDEFSWFMDEARLDLLNTLIDPSAMTFQELANRDQSNFFSMHADQDSLHFLSPNAMYKVEEGMVECREVKSVAVADAEIKPDQGLLVLRRDAVMDPLVNAEIFANDVTRYHRLYEANIQINGRLDYEGAASKTYVDAIGKEWPIRLNDLSVDTANRTVGHGLVRAGEELFLSPEFAFRGRVHLEAGRKDLEFEGGAQMQFECEDYGNEWVEFKGVINPADVAIPVDSLVTEMGKAHLGVGWTYNSGGIKSMYPTFFSKKPVRSDVSFFVPRGLLRYDKRNDRYVVCSEEKHKNRALPGNLTQMSRGGCEVWQQGRASFPLNDLHMLKQEFIGDIATESGQMELRGGMVVDMPMPEAVLKYLKEQIQASDLASGAGYTSTNYESMLGELLGVDEAAKLVTELDRNGEEYKKQVPKEVAKAMVFHGMEWRYDSFDDRWLSEGEVVIATMGEQNVWRRIKGKVAVDRENEEVIVYLHFGRKHWYFFQWKANQGYMQVQAMESKPEGEETLEVLIADLKKSETEFTEGAGKFQLQWINGDVWRTRFTKDFREFDE